MDRRCETNGLSPIEKRVIDRRNGNGRAGLVCRDRRCGRNGRFTRVATGQADHEGIGKARAAASESQDHGSCPRILDNGCFVERQRELTSETRSYLKLTFRETTIIIGDPHGCIIGTWIVVGVFCIKETHRSLASTSQIRNNRRTG